MCSSGVDEHEDMARKGGGRCHSKPSPSNVTVDNHLKCKNLDSLDLLPLPLCPASSTPLVPSRLSLIKKSAPAQAGKSARRG